MGFNIGGLGDKLQGVVGSLKEGRVGELLQKLPLDKLPVEQLLQKLPLEQLLSSSFLQKVHSLRVLEGAAAKRRILCRLGRGDKVAPAGSAG
ncbi:hypothetical protein ACFSQ7_23590 [Paenibacillus rhizoplanae]